MTARHAAHRRSPWRPLALSAVGSAVVLFTAGQGVWATLNATAHGGTQSVSTGSLMLTASGSSLAAAISGLGPGDTVNRHLTLTNGGNLGATGISLGLAASAPSSTLITDTATTFGLRITVNSCTVAWTATAGTCSGTKAVALSQRPVSSLIGTPADLTLPAGSTDPGSKVYLQISLVLPTQDETSTNGVGPTNSVQNVTTNVTYTFTATQRTATVSNS